MNILIYGAVNSITFALIAVGFTLVYGVSRLPNFAHGAFYVLVGFLTWSFFNQLNIPYLVAALLSLSIATLLGLLMYRFVLIRIRGIPTSEIIASFAIGLIILEGLQYKGFIGPFYVLPSFVDGTLTVAGATIDYQRIFVLAAGLGLVAFMWFFTHHTRIGLSLRAIAQDEHAAMMLGIDADRTATISLALGSALAGIAALIILPLGNVTAKAGYDALLQALAVCIIGGLGSWAGAVIGSFVLGYALIITTALFGAMWESVVLVGLIITILIVKPSGFLGKQKELEERV